MLKKYAILLSPDVAATAAPPAPAAKPAAAPPSPATAKPSAAPPPSAPPAPAAADDPFAGYDADFMPAKKADAPPPEPPLKAGDKPAAEKVKPAESQNMRQVREQLEKTQSELQTKTKAATELEQRIKSLEDRGRDAEALKTRLATLEKERDSLSAELSQARFQASPEWKRNYESKWKDIFADAYDVVTALQIGRYGEGESGLREFQPERVVDWNKDFLNIYSIEDRATAYRAIRERFSAEDGQFVIDHYNRMKAFEKEKIKALEAERDTWKARQTEQQTKAAENRERWQADTLTVRKDLENRLPDLYADDPTDPETKKRLDQGWELLDRQPKTYQEAVILQTRNRMNAATAPMLQYKLSKAQKKITDLETKVKELMGQGPGPTKRTGGAPVGGEEDWEGDFINHMKRGKA